MANKSRLLFILDYLKNHTDTNRMISADSLMKLCGENGLTISRNTLRDDIAALIYSGCGIECVHSDGRAYYYMADRPFSKAELKLLIDAVASSNLLTRGDSERMIEKLKGLINEEQRPSLTYMMSQRKAEDETAVRKIVPIISGTAVMKASRRASGDPKSTPIRTIPAIPRAPAANRASVITRRNRSSFAMSDTAKA